MAPEPIEPPKESVAEAGYRLNAAKRAVIIFGFGASQNLAEITAIANGKRSGRMDSCKTYFRVK